jgi:hypothetical protein
MASRRSRKLAPYKRSECFGYGDVLDILVQKRKDKRAAECFFKKLMKGQGSSAREIVTDKLPSYGAARKAIMKWLQIKAWFFVFIEHYFLSCYQHNHIGTPISLVPVYISILGLCYQGRQCAEICLSARDVE